MQIQTKEDMCHVLEQTMLFVWFCQFEELGIPINFPLGPVQPASWSSQFFLKPGLLGLFSL